MDMEAERNDGFKLDATRLPFPVLTGPPWQGIRYFCTTRHGGISQPPWDSFNLGTHVGDDARAVTENRNQDGRPGYWVVTPLLLGGADGDTCAHGPAAVLVLRGWLPRRFDATLPSVPAPPGVQRIHGQLLSRVPRMYELPSLWGKAREPLHDANEDALGKTKSIRPDARAPTPPVVTNLTLIEAARATKLTLLPVVLQQLPNPAAPHDDLVRQWAGPSVDADKNIGYAIQWFSFAAIALCAALGISWRTWRARTHRQAT